MPEKPPSLFETPRLQLRKPVMEDAASIFRQYGQDQEISRYLSWKPHQSITDTEKFLKRCIRSWKEATSFPWIIISKSNKSLVGMIEITAIDQHGANVGYVLARQYWGNGYATEALKTIIDWALDQDDIFRVWAICDSENTASARVLERCTMQKEGILRRWLVLPNISNKPRDFFCYSIVK